MSFDESRLLDTLKEIRDDSDPPQNESTTCDWVILPLLLAIGYHKKEIVSRIADNNGQFPDYTLLANSNHTWFLEAKDWNTTLQDSHVQQSLNYANQNGKRWVVLTNGRSWRLYDNQTQGVASDKRVTEAAISDIEEIKELLLVLSRDSVCSDGIASFANYVRVRSALDRQLTDEDSDVIKAIWKELRQHGLGGISRETIAAYFVGRLRFALDAPSKVGAEARVPSHRPPDVAGTSDAIEKDLESVSRANKSLIVGKRPVSITLPDGTTSAVKSWNELGVEIVRWLGRNRVLPDLPFRGARGGGVYFLNTHPHDRDHPMTRFSDFEYNGGRVFVNTNYNASQLVNALCWLCESIGQPPGSFTIKIVP